MADRFIMIRQCTLGKLLKHFPSLLPSLTAAWVLLFFGEVLVSLKPPKWDVWPAAHVFTSSHLTPACLGTRINTHRLLKGHWGDAHFGLLKWKKALNAVMESVWIVYESQGIDILISSAVSGIYLILGGWLWKNGSMLCIQINDLWVVDVGEL